MGGWIKSAAFLFAWIFAAQAFAADPSLRPTAPRLAVVQRAGETQLWFFWKNPAGYSETTDKGTYRLTFETPAAVPAGRLKQILTALPEKWRGLDLKQEDGKLVFSVKTPAGGTVAAAASGNGVRVSLYDGDLPKPEKAAEPAVESKTVAPKAEPVPAPAPEPAAAPAVPDVPAESVTPAEPEKAVETPYAEAQETVSLTLSAPQSFEEKIEHRAVKSADVSGYRAASLSFPWNRMTAVAAFRRDGYVWIVFDRKAEFDFSLERELYKDIILEMVQIPHSQATIFRLVTQKGYNPSLRREGLLWVVDLMYQPVRPKQAANLILQRKTPFGARIFVPLDESAQVIPLLDPEVGDLMYIVPVFAQGKGVPNPRSFVDADFLQTAQGLVVVPNTEDLSVYSSTSGVEIRGPKKVGMRFSSEDILAFLTKSKISTDPAAQILDVAAWGGDDPDRYIATLKQRQNAVVDAKPTDKDLNRLILARYYFANGMYPETLSVLRVIAGGDGALAGSAGVVALRGAANFMMMRYDEAIKDLSSPLLKNDSASDYWRAATLAASSRTPEAYLQAMKDNMGILRAYPYPVKTRLALAGLHAAVAAGDEFSIQNFMEAAFNSQNTDAENDEIAFYHALWQESTGMYTMARAEMKRLAAGKDFYFRAMGGLESVRMDTRAHAITPQERIEELERLSYAWRGGEFEYNLMTMLVAAYQDQKNFSQVLHILKNMQMRFDGMPESKKIHKLMEDIFQKLYLNEDETLLPPVKAIALYDEFKELTPKGEKGAQIVRRLADRLVSIDLLDRAADLLDEQLRQPVGNRERGLISTRLALVRLLNKEPQKALDALKVAENNAFSEKVQRQRRHIKAKALADLKQPENAAKLLEDDESEEAKMLRAEIYWQAQIWDKAADALKLLIAKPRPNVPLTRREAQRVLDWAAALRLAGRPKIVMRLRDNFMPYMEKTDLAQAFDFITKTPQQGLLDYHQVAKEVESAESFHSFAKEYSEMIKSQGLSQTVR